MKVILAILLTILICGAATAYAANRSCMPTQDMAASMFAEGQGFTATFIIGDEIKGVVMQLYRGPRGFTITHVRNWGRTSCVFIRGSEWQWADPTLQ